MTTRVTQQRQGVQPFLLPSLSFPSPTSTSYSQPVCHQCLCLPIISNSLLTLFLDFFHSQLVLLAERHPATASSLSENQQLRKRFFFFFHFINPKLGNCTVAASKITSKTELYYAGATNCKYFTLVSNTWMNLCATKNQGRCAKTVTNGWKDLLK